MGGHMTNEERDRLEAKVRELTGEEERRLTHYRRTAIRCAREVVGVRAIARVGTPRDDLKADHHKALHALERAAELYPDDLAIKAARSIAAGTPYVKNRLEHGEFVAWRKSRTKEKVDQELADKLGSPGEKSEGS